MSDELNELEERQIYKSRLFKIMGTNKADDDTSKDASETYASAKKLK